MRFMLIYKPGSEQSKPSDPERFVAVGNLIGEMAQSGVLLATDGLLPSSHGARLRISGDGIFTLTDGPFTEAKELIGGFAIVRVNSKDEAIEHAKRFLSITGQG